MRLSVACLVLLLTFAGCGGSDSPDADFNNERTTGNPAVFERINSLTNCTELQREFDIAGDNTDRIQDEGGDSSIPQSYMRAADNRMQEVGCYG